MKKEVEEAGIENQQKERQRFDQKRKRKGKGKKGDVEWEMGERKKKERSPLATFRFALIKATWSSPQIPHTLHFDSTPRI